jgi:hypothetical protein
VRGNDLPNTVGHEEHYLEMSVVNLRIIMCLELTPTVAFLVKPPMLDETRLMHMMYGMVFTKRTVTCQYFLSC